MAAAATPAAVAGADPAAAAPDPATAGAEPATIVAGTQLAFDPPALSLAAGEEQTVLLYASGADGLASSKIAIDFDPAVLEVSKIEPLGRGTIEPISAGRLALVLPGGGTLSQSHPIARLTVRGVAAGTSSLSLDATAMTLETGGPAIVSSSPAAVEVR